MLTDSSSSATEKITCSCLYTKIMTAVMYKIRRLGYKEVEFIIIITTVLELSAFSHMEVSSMSWAWKALGEVNKIFDRC